MTSFLAGKSELVLSITWDQLCRVKIPINFDQQNTTNIIALNILIHQQEVEDIKNKITKMARSFHSVKYYLCLFAVLALAALFEVGVFDMETSQISDGNMKKRFTFGNSEVCDLRTPTKAVPVVLFALGRSGSSVTWTTLTSLAGKENIAYEVLGGNKEKNIKFFKDLEKSPNKDQNWLINSLCNVRNFRKDVQNANVYGIQWKPYRATWDEGKLSQIVYSNSKT